MRTIVIAAFALFVAGCAGSTEIRYVDKPVPIEVPVVAQDSTAHVLREWLRQQEPPTTLNALTDSTSTEKIAQEALLEVAYWRSFWNRLNRLLDRINE